MPKRSKAERKERRQQIVGNVKAFIDKHDDKVLPIIKTVLAKKFPVASEIIEAIKEARDSKLPADTKQVTIDGLQELLATIDEDDEEAAASLVNSTLISKFITPTNLIFCAITFYGAIITEIAHYWGILPQAVDKTILATLGGMYASMHGMHMWQRGEVKKKAIEINSAS